MDLEDEESLHAKLRTKGKSQNYLLKSDILELKPRRRRQGKCFGAALEYQESVEYPIVKKEPDQQSYIYISNDIWFHLANYVAPEDIQRFSLICSQSANAVNSCRFWLQLYRRYCQNSTGSSKKWILQLPPHLQVEHMTTCDKKILRQRVIQSLFYCYPPFQNRIEETYSLATLIGRTYISSWHKQIRCVWIMCYKFRLNFPLTATFSNDKPQSNLENNNNETNVVNDWESLADECNTKLKKDTTTANDLDGVCLLVISCNRFIPFPSDIVYNYATCPFRLAATRELLSTDMRSTNLELDFVSSSRDQTITVKYTKIHKYKVFPWWHPNFRIMNKCG